MRNSFLASLASTALTMRLAFADSHLQNLKHLKSTRSSQGWLCVRDLVDIPFPMCNRGRKNMPGLQGLVSVQSEHRDTSPTTGWFMSALELWGLVKITRGPCMTPQSELQHHPRPKPRAADRKGEDVTNNKSTGRGPLPEQGRGSTGEGWRKTERTLM